MASEIWILIVTTVIYILGIILRKYFPKKATGFRRLEEVLKKEFKKGDKMENQSIGDYNRQIKE
ncbi:MAG: hypothetical protein VXB01_02580, partial [Opitutae bacterium]